jgi:uncharacterized protein
MGENEKISELEAELTKTKYNKRTQHHIGLVKAKIAKLKQDIETKKRGKGKTDGFVLKKSGDATVVLVGFPSVGKSTLLNKLTNANSKVAAYEFTTLTVIPGTLEHKHAQIQIFDVPGIVGGASEGTGRGREVLAAIRSADMIIVLLDIHQLSHFKFLMKELHNSDFRLNKKKPDVIIKKKPRGGISIASTVPLKADKKTLIGILSEFKIMNADVLIRTPIDEEEMIDCIEGSKKYLPGLIVVNKIDTASEEQVEDAKKRFPKAVFISADSEINLDELKERIYGKLKFMSIYLKEPGKEPDMDKPLIMRQGDSIKDLCDHLHKDFARRYKFCRVWGKSPRYPGQKIVSLTHILMDGDVAELHLR